MAPELSHGAEHATPRSDVFSLGFVAYEMLTGRAPFERPLVKSPKDRRPPPDPPPPIASLLPGLPAELAAIVDQCLQFTPGARPDAATIARAFIRATAT
jgi:serine/threonine-protein kinase